MGSEIMALFYGARTGVNKMVVMGRRFVGLMPAEQHYEFCTVLIVIT